MNHSNVIVFFRLRRKKILGMVNAYREITSTHACLTVVSLHVRKRKRKKRFIPGFDFEVKFFPAQLMKKLTL